LLVGDHAKCPGCDANVEIKELGYVPLYRQDGKPMFVVVQSYIFETLDVLKLHTHVEWGREKAKGEGIWVRKSELNRPWHSTIPAKMRPADLTEALCKVWRMPELLAYARAWLLPSDNGVSPAPAEKPATVLAQVHEIEDRARAELRAVMKRQFPLRKGEPQMVEDLMPEPSANGKHGRK